MLNPLLDELRQEAATTRRVLERVPADKLTWKPHSKSMSLGQLALHVANIPHNVSKLAQLDQYDASNTNFEPATPNNIDEILSTHDLSLRTAEDYLNSIDDKIALASWRLTNKGKEVFTIPRIGLIRSIMLNHWYHHRGQLSVYLRLLDIPVPTIYGRSADENPFG
ncbi:MAG: DinB family protein [Acidobacteriota bacterium]